METTKTTRKSLPWWAWAFPVLFGLLGGVISWTCFRKRENAGMLVVVGLIFSVIASAVSW